LSRPARPVVRAIPGSLLVGLALLAACGGCGAKREIPTGSEPPVTQTPPGFDLVRLDLQLDDPVHLAAPVGDPRLFVVEQEGRIRIVRDETLVEQPFLDISHRVASGGERGLLSVAFHPDFKANGSLFVNFTDLDGTTRIERYQVSSDPDIADPQSSSLLLSIEQPYANHNGGHLLFGPDGYLYVGVGDGGRGGDPLGSGQDRETLLGTILRLDVDGALPYGIPPDNPWADHASFRPEIWAWGLRNPWRLAFDAPADLLYVADVGQNSREEVNVVAAGAAGLNFGWNTMEGTDCFERATCSQDGLVLPAVEYDHSSGCSVTGGEVYRGSRIPEVQGLYFYSDYCNGWLRSFRFENGVAVDHREWDVGAIGSVVSFGTDGVGELYALSRAGVYRFEPSTP